MGSLTFSWLWCVVQVTIVSTVALIVAFMNTRRRPEVVAATGGWAAFTALVMTALIPASIPHSLVARVSSFATSKSSPSTMRSPYIETDRAAATEEALSGDPNTEAAAGFALNPAALLLRIAKLNQPAASDQSDLAKYIAIGIGVGIMFGFVKLAMGLVLLRSLHRRAKVIEDNEFLALAKEIAVEMGCHQQLRYATTKEVGCAAVVGFFRPTVLVSNQWRTWSMEDRRTVLAHELAHVCRHDSTWRLVATSCQIVHFYNPLTRWLAARLVLAQELAADRLAVPSAGGTGSYLRSLSRLALEEDARPNVRSHLTVTPVFSGHLLRRVEMLRAMDCQQDRSSRRWLSSGIVVSIMLFGMTTTAMRGFAEAETDEESETKSDVVLIPKTVFDISRFGRGTLIDDTDGVITLVRGTSGQAHVGKSQTALFDGKKIPSTHPTFHHCGALHLNLAALSQTRLWPLVEASISEFLPMSVSKSWDLRSLEGIFSDAVLTVRAKKTPDEKNQIMFGTSGVLLQASRDVDWRTAIHNEFADAADGTKDDVDFIDAMIPQMGTMAVRFHEINHRELAVLLRLPADKQDLHKWLDPTEEDRRHSWADDWNAISGGVMTVAMANRNPDEPISFKDAFDDEDAAHHCGVIFHGIKQFSWGIDVSGDSSIVAMRIRLRCHESAEPDLLLAATRDLLKALQREATSGEEKASPNTIEAMFNQILREAYASATTELIRDKDNVIECQLKGTLSPEFLTAIQNLTTKENAVIPAGETAVKEERATIR